MIDKIRTLAIHLPQFHPIPENDEWWGKGFTEWTNVAKAKPLFPGHDQPRIPADLGFYDLRLPEAREAQAKLAREYGIDGSCYYHYWFNGRRLLDRPVRDILASQRPDFPFCLFWANETWSRRWLGEERDILIEQTYSESDNIAHARYLASVFQDHRYIQVGGRPLFLIYRPTHIPILAHFISTLRECSRAAGTGDPFLLGCSSHAEGTDMRTLGLDGTMDFQPKLGFLPEAFEDKSTPERLARNRALGVDSPDLRLYDAKDFRQRIEDFRDQLDYPVHPSVFVSWDNTPRRGENGIVLLNNTPEDFAKSLESAKRHVNSPKFQGEKVVFINAWNEWAEGNYLEPDSSHGKKFLVFLNAQNIQEDELKTDSQHKNAFHTTQTKNSDQEFIKEEHGWCPICEKEAVFTAKNLWLRDNYLCSGCGSIPRERAIMHVIQTRYPNWRELRIHESSPSSRGTSVKLAKECKHYTASQYDPDLGFGNTHPSQGYRSENLEQQTFSDESFDIVVSQDVLEHIFDAEAAFRDIHRTLKPGGAHIFTTPLVNKEKPTQRRAELRPDGTVHHLFPPEYHGNPMSSEGSLVTFHWGFDIADFIQKSVSDDAEIIHPTNPHMGIEAEYIEVVVQRKDLNGKESSARNCVVKKKKEIFLHVGTPKTGTSSIQRFFSHFSINHNELNLCYFNELLDSENEPQHYKLFHNFNENYNKIVDSILYKDFNIGVFSSELLTFLINSENFYNLIQKLVKKLNYHGIRFNVVGTVRDPLSYIVSAYCENVTGGGCPHPLNEWLNCSAGAAHIDVIKSLNIWNNLLGVDNVFWFKWGRQSGVHSIDCIIKKCLINKLSSQEINKLKEVDTIRESYTGSIIESIRRINELRGCVWDSYNGNLSLYTFVRNELKKNETGSIQFNKLLLSKSPRINFDSLRNLLKESYVLFNQIKFENATDHDKNPLSVENIEKALSKLTYNEDLVSYYFNQWNGKI